MKSMPVLFLLFALMGPVLVSAKCDESKCRSPDLYSLVFKTGYDCWAYPDNPITPEPYTCAEGYTAKAIESVPKVSGYSYYTCCTADEPSTTTPINECNLDTYPGVCTSSDGGSGFDCWADCHNEPMTCGGTKYTAPRKTGATMSVWGSDCHQYICCTSGAGTHNPTSAVFILVSSVVLCMNQWLALI
jgi:hypothetical protein